MNSTVDSPLKAQMSEVQSAPVTFHPKSAKTGVAHAQAESWSLKRIQELFDLPFNDLMHQAQAVHRAHFSANEVQLSTLLSIKTGGCPEDCGYCPQSVHHETGVEATKLMGVEEVRAAALEAKQHGASRFCMGAAWRELHDRDVEKVAELIKVVKDLEMEACCTLGMLTQPQAHALKEAGLDYYNHNLDTTPELYGDIITTRVYEDRLNTLGSVRNAGMNVCSGGIVGMGESRAQRAGLIHQLANLSPYPESVPINHLVHVEGTPLSHLEDLDPLEFVRTIAVARITMPTTRVRLSAGRQALGDGIQALCFLAGANSIFYGDKLLTTGNPNWALDQALFTKLGIHAV